MKTFLLSMLLGVGFSTVAAVAVARAVLPEEVWGQPGQSLTEMTTQPFGQRDAIEVVARRFRGGTSGWPVRRTLRTRATVEYHSPDHWTVRLDDASWTAHGRGGPGPHGCYAEPDNDAARALEARTGQAG
jgi:hypothetical protein